VPEVRLYGKGETSIFTMSLRGGHLLFPTTLAPYASAVSNPQLFGDCFGYTCPGGQRQGEQERLAATLFIIENCRIPIDWNTKKNDNGLRGENP
jgi:hypothetical protein